MKRKNLIKIVGVFSMVMLTSLTIPTVTISNEQEPNYETDFKSTEITVEVNDKVIVSSAGTHDAIDEEVKDVFMYSTATVKVRREPSSNKDNVVGLIPANSEMIWLENVDDMWSKVKINDVEYFICKDYITTIAPENVISILNIEPTHEGVYFVNKSSGEEVSNPNYVSLGTFKLTAYCPCSKCCGKWANDASVKVGSIGVPLVQGTSIAVDPKVIPYRSSVYIDGHEYKAHDCGRAIKGNRIDVYFEDHSVALQFGVQYKEVFIWKY